MAGANQVSVIIPVRDRPHEVKRAVLSVLAQGRYVGEVLVIENGSSLSSDITKLSPKVSYEVLKATGVSRARNRGVQMSRFPLIAFLDSDDEWLPGKLDAQIQYLSLNPTHEIVQTDELWIRNGRRVNKKKHHVLAEGECFDACVQNCCISPSSVLLTRDLFLREGGFDEELSACEDYALWLRISRREKVGLIRRGLIQKYGGHSDQLSRTIPGLDRLRVYALFRLLQTSELTETQRSIVYCALRKKLLILETGRAKRGEPLEQLHLLQRQVEAMSSGEPLREVPELLYLLDREKWS